MILEAEKFNKRNEEDMDSDSTILYDIPETEFVNKGDSIETNNLSEPTLLLEAAKTRKLQKNL